MFELTNQPIQIQEYSEQLSTVQAGAYVSFEGWVRNHNQGKEVLWLEYEAYEKMAALEGVKVVNRVSNENDIIRAHCVHRTGYLKVGDIAVWVGVTAVHRKAAFIACTKIIDRIKSRVPIWKKEHYSDGSSEWVNCTNCVKK